MDSEATNVFKENSTKSKIINNDWIKKVLWEIFRITEKHKSTELNKIYQINRHAS